MPESPTESPTTFDNDIRRRLMDYARFDVSQEFAVRAYRSAALNYPIQGAVLDEMPGPRPPGWETVTRRETASPRRQWITADFGRVEERISRQWDWEVPLPPIENRGGDIWIDEWLGAFNNTPLGPRDITDYQTQGDAVAYNLIANTRQRTDTYTLSGLGNFSLSTVHDGPDQGDVLFNLPGGLYVNLSKPQNGVRRSHDYDHSVRPFTASESVTLIMR